MGSRTAFLLGPTLACLTAVPLASQVTVTREKDSLRPGQGTTLTATLAGDSRPVQWRWTLLDPDAGTLVPGADGTCSFTASGEFLLTSRTVRVQVAPLGAPLVPAAVATLVLDPGPHRLVFEKLLPATGFLEHPDPLEPTLGPLVGVHGQGAGPESKSPFGLSLNLAFAGRCPGSVVDGKWLVLDCWRDRILLMSAEGQVEPWLDARTEDKDAPREHAKFKDPNSLAVYHPGPSEGPGAWRVAVTEVTTGVIRTVDAQGMVTTLAGVPGKTGYFDGPAGRSLFKGLMDVAWGRDGALYVADPGNRVIRKVYRGQVTTLAGTAFQSATDDDTGLAARQAESVDGTGPAARFEEPFAIAADPVSGHLYVLDGKPTVLRRVTLDGVVTTLAGSRKQHGFESWTLRPDLPGGALRLRGVPCLSYPHSLACHLGKVYIADTGNRALRVFDPETGRLTTLAGHPSQDGFRAGRLRAGRDLPPQECAALDQPSHLAFDDQGHCLVTMLNPKTWSSIAELSMSGLLPRPERPAAETDGSLDVPLSVHSAIADLGLTGDIPEDHADDPRHGLVRDLMAELGLAGRPGGSHAVGDHKAHRSGPWSFVAEMD